MPRESRRLTFRATSTEKIRNNPSKRQVGDRQQLLGYVRLLADALALRDWAFELSEDSPRNERAEAETECVGGRKFAKMRVGAKFWQHDGADQRHTITHELLHCHVALMHSVLLDEAACSIASPTLDVLQASHLRAMEFAVDGIADAVAPLLPLPEWWATS